MAAVGVLVLTRFKLLSSGLRSYSRGLYGGTEERTDFNVHRNGSS
jgi:hypothetical protein